MVLVLVTFMLFLLANKCNVWIEVRLFGFLHCWVGGKLSFVSRVTRHVSMIVVILPVAVLLLVCCMRMRVLSETLH